MGLVRGEWPGKARAVGVEPLANPLQVEGLPTLGQLFTCLTVTVRLM